LISNEFPKLNTCNNTILSHLSYPSTSGPPTWRNSKALSPPCDLSRSYAVQLRRRTGPRLQMRWYWAYLTRGSDSYTTPRRWDLDSRLVRILRHIIETLLAS